MLLANLSVQGFVTEQVNAYLTKNKLTFLAHFPLTSCHSIRKQDISKT